MARFSVKERRSDFFLRGKKEEKRFLLPFRVASLDRSIEIESLIVDRKTLRVVVSIDHRAMALIASIIEIASLFHAPYNSPPPLHLCSSIRQPVRVCLSPLCVRASVARVRSFARSYVSRASYDEFDWVIPTRRGEAREVTPRDTVCGF